MTDRIDYRRVRCRIDRITRDAVGIQNADLTGIPFAAWIPLSLLHTLDERTLTSGTVQRGDEMVLRIAAWKVGELRLPTETNR